MNAKSKHTIAVTATENALRPAMYAKGKPIAAMNILDRMKYYHVPGVSVAVIDNGKIDWAKGNDAISVKITSLYCIIPVLKKQNLPSHQQIRSRLRAKWVMLDSVPVG